MRQRALLTALPDLIFRNDRQGTFLDYHAPLQAKLAAKPEEFLGRKITDVFAPEMAALHMKYLNHVFETGQETTYEYSMPIGSRFHPERAAIWQVNAPVESTERWMGPR